MTQSSPTPVVAPWEGREKTKKKRLLFFLFFPKVSVSSTRAWSGAGWLLYLAGSVGYLCADLVPSHVPDWFWLFLALLFVVDALLYLAAWFCSPNASLDLWCWSELVNVAASVFCAVAAGLFLLDLPRDSALAAQTFLQLESSLYFTGTTLFLFNSLMTASLFVRSSPGAPLFRDPAWHAELFNLLPALGYFATGVLRLACTVQLASLHDSSDALFAASLRLIRFCRSVNILFDVMYVFDALCYAAVWVAEQTPDVPSIGPMPLTTRKPGDFGAL